DGRRARRLRAQAEAAGAPETAGADIPAARGEQQPLDPAADPTAGEIPVQDPYAAVPQQQSYEEWQAAQQGVPTQPGQPGHAAEQQPYQPADPYQAGQYGAQYPQADPYQAPDPYAADPYQAGAYDPYGYGQQQYTDGRQQPQQPYDDGTEYPGYSGSYPEPRRDGSDQQ
ncbi:family 2 glycosyl transferase, partial [Streptomyces inhibens]